MKDALLLVLAADSDSNSDATTATQVDVQSSSSVGGSTVHRSRLNVSVKVSKEEAVATVKETVRGGLSFVVLATVRLPVVDEVFFIRYMYRTKCCTP